MLLSGALRWEQRLRSTCSKEMADWSSDVLKLKAWEVARAVASGPRCSDHRLGVQVVAEATGRKNSLAQGRAESGTWAEDQPGRNSHN